ncbi:hypothetical protein, partial [Alkalihalobacillus trypoxylicola]|uniref:hypothetical protein n=1 Tax=Alkalihalobacillus trypoxylicola TaxID=519424 RepID=UPI001C3F7107
QKKSSIHPKRELIQESGQKGTVYSSETQAHPGKRSKGRAPFILKELILIITVKRNSLISTFLPLFQTSLHIHVIKK